VGLPAFVRGVNIAAEFDLGFTEPFSRLSFKVQALAKESKDPQPLTFAFTRLGDAVPKTSPFAEAVERNRFQVFTNVSFLDSMILAKQQGNMQLAQEASMMLHATVMFAPVCNPNRTGKHETSLPYIGFTKRDNSAVARANTMMEIQVLMNIKAQIALPNTAALFQTLATNGDTWLVAQLRDPDPWVRWAAVMLIGRKHLHEEKELIQLLWDPVAEVRVAAHQALVRVARGTDLGPNPMDSPAKVQQAIQRWNSWLEAQQADRPTVNIIPVSGASASN
jgi:hypothetical protein